MPRIVDRDVERARLAQAAVGLFAEHGFARLSMRAAADALGVSTGTLYHYFDDKADLFAAVVGQVVEADLGEVGGNLRALPLPLRLRALLAATQYQLPRLVRDYRVLIEAVAVTPGRFDAAIAEASARYHAAVAEVLALDPGRTELVLLTLSGLILRTLCGDTSTDLDLLHTTLLRQLQEAV